MRCNWHTFHRCTLRLQSFVTIYPRRRAEQKDCNNFTGSSCWVFLIQPFPLLVMVLLCQCENNRSHFLHKGPHLKDMDGNMDIYTLKNSWCYTPQPQQKAVLTQGPCFVYVCVYICMCVKWWYLFSHAPLWNAPFSGPWQGNTLAPLATFQQLYCVTFLPLGPPLLLPFFFGNGNQTSTSEKLNRNWKWKTTRLN